MPRVIVACPKGFVTGGPEALHQLASTLKGLEVDTFLWDPEISRARTEPAKEFSRYGVDWIENQPVSSDVLVIPETMGDLIPKFFSNQTIILWWLSVDNFVTADRIPLDVIKDGYPNIIHAYQSEYARNFLITNGFENLISLTDYINDEFITKAREINHHQILGLKNVVAVNPSKGFTRAKKVIENIDNDQVILLENMSRDAAIKALAKCDFYIDLGDHPGTDRFPREAALMNCIVLTNIRGSAGNKVDIPIQVDLFKFDDNTEDFQDEIIRKLKVFGEDFSYFLDKQDSYRELILEGKERFENEVAALFQNLEGLREIRPENREKIPNSIYLFLSNLIHERDAIIHERDAIIHERDAIIHERDAIIHERDAMVHKIEAMNQSTSWRVTAPIRSFLEMSKRLSS